ncbi:MAG: hypothetical protein JRE43_06820, partial [Deltaproteobacteria bacterium]|nr:hypothetical protein [Deltaproteobacteria bacterium]
MLIRKRNWHHSPRTRFVAFTGIQAALFLALFAAMAGLALADEIEPEPPSEAPVAEKPAPDAPPAPAPPAQAKQGASHVHEVNPAARRTAKQVVEDIWTRDK